ncbi:hypothetical protein LINPERHAP2_LOCUS35277 [Linum perenne]
MPISPGQRSARHEFIPSFTNDGRRTFHSGRR